MVGISAVRTDARRALNFCGTSQTYCFAPPEGEGFPVSPETTPQTPGHSAADACIQQGLAASRADQVDQAIELFQQAAQLAPHSGLPHFLIGAELAQTGRLPEAEAAFALSVLLAPALEMARFQLGLLQLTSGRPALAMVTWGPLLERPASNALQRVVSGFSALIQGDPATARTCIEEGIALNRENEALNRDLQQLLSRLDASTVENQAASASPQPSSQPDGSDGLHVLLNNYHQGQLH